MKSRQLSQTWGKPLVVAVVLSVALFGCSKSDVKSAEDKAVQEAAKTVMTGADKQNAGAKSKLGDLSSFRTIVTDTAAIVDKGDLNAAKLRIKDLEMTWDSAEAGLKPRSATDWHAVDSAIDTALKALRADNPNQAECKQALVSVIKVMDSLS